MAGGMRRGLAALMGAASSERHAERFSDGLLPLFNELERARQANDDAEVAALTGQGSVEAAERTFEVYAIARGRFVTALIEHDSEAVS